MLQMQKQRASLFPAGAPQQETGLKHDASGTPVTPYGHGNTGLFNIPGTDVRVFSAITYPLEGMLGRIPVRFGDPILGGFGGYQQNLFTTITGITADNATLANQPTAICQRFPGGGLMKVATVASPMGRYGHAIDELHIEDAALLMNRADPTYMQLMNMGGDNVLMPSVGGRGNLLLSELQRRITIAYFNWRLYMQRQVWTGNPLNTANKKGYMEWVGLDLQINTGTQRDYQSSAVATALDSDVKDFGCQSINGGPLDIVQYLEMIHAYLEDKARKQGLAPVQWVIAMRPELFRELTQMFSVRQYQAALAQISQAQFSGGRVMIDARDAKQQSIDMYSRKYLPLNGQMVEVVPDDGIFEQNVTNNGALSPGQYCSDIYFIPMAVLGGVDVLYLEPFRMDNTLSEEIANLGGIPLATFTSDGGLFRWYKYQTGGCISWDFVMRGRIVLRTPQLAGRLKNVRYQPLQHFTDASQSSVYYQDGGVTSSPEIRQYVPWTTTPVVVK